MLRIVFLNGFATRLSKASRARPRPAFGDLQNQRGLRFSAYGSSLRVFFGQLFGARPLKHMWARASQLGSRFLGAGFRL